MLIQDRVRLIIKANSLTSSEFADRIGIKRSNLSHVLNGRNKPGLDFLSKIIDEFPNVNASWLLTGVQRDGSFQSPQSKKEESSNSMSSPTSSPTNKEINTEIERIVVFYKNGTFSTYTN